MGWTAPTPAYGCCVRHQIKRVRLGLFGREALAHLLSHVRRRFGGSSTAQKASPTAPDHLRAVIAGYQRLRLNAERREVGAP